MGWEKFISFGLGCVDFVMFGLYDLILSDRFFCFFFYLVNKYFLFIIFLGNILRFILNGS